MSTILQSVRISGGVSLGPPPALTWSGQYTELTDVLYTAETSELAFGTGDFTAECFVNLQSSAAVARILISMRNTANNLFNNVFAIINGYPAWSNGFSWSSAASPLPLNQWVHLALVRNSGNLRIYMGGISELSITYGDSIIGNRPIFIGNSDDPNYSLDNGLMSNVRITNTAVYTSNFTPPASPLTAISGTVILTLQDSTAIDNGPNNFTITNNGVVLTPTGPF